MKNVKYIAFLRGINIGGHKKVPMAELRNQMEKQGFRNVITLLNSGNVIFETETTVVGELEKTVADFLKHCFGFPVPVLIRKSEDLRKIQQHNPFGGVKITKDIRLYVSFLKQAPDADVLLPWMSEDRSFQILDVKEKMVFSVLDLSVSGTVKAMEILERFYGKEITTRNWNTVQKIINKL